MLYTLELYTMPLTDLEIRRSKPREKSYTLNDGNGLSLLIEPNGSRGWRFRYRFDGKPKMISLGTYPDVTLLGANVMMPVGWLLVA